MKKSTKILINILLISLMIVAFATTVQAAEEDGIFGITISAGGATEAVSKVKSISGSILSVVQTVGVAVATIILVVLAIKYIAASPNDKAEIKKHAVVYVIGAVLLYGASGVLAIIKNLGKVVSGS